MAKAFQTLAYLEKELRTWSGVTFEVEHLSTHPKLWVCYNSNRRFLIFSSTNVDPRGIRNKVSQLRRLLRELGAEKVK
jgi:hypothetical protein